ncbi:MAG: hypothetical protein AABO41_28105 [Acidobacteriota bacterium]
MQEATHRQSTENRMGADRIPWGWVVGTAIGLEAAMVISAFAWVAIYAYLIHPGEDAAYYENYAQVASPVVAVVVGMPYWFFGCRWVTRKAGTRAVQMALWAWFIVFIIDVPLNFLGEPTVYNWVMVVIAHSTQLLGAYLGGRAALKNVA